MGVFGNSRDGSSIELDNYCLIGSPESVISTVDNIEQGKSASLRY